MTPRSLLIPFLLLSAIPLAATAGFLCGQIKAKESTFIHGAIKEAFKQGQESILVDIIDNEIVVAQR